MHPLPISRIAAPKPNSMRASSPEGVVSRFGAALARRIWIALLLIGVTSFSAVFLYARPSAPWRHAYVATQMMRVVTSVGSTATSYDVYLAHQEAQSVARDIADGSLFSFTSFEIAVTNTLAAHHASLVSRFGSDVPSEVSASELASALTATNSADVVVISCQWINGGGASALLSAAVSVLAGASDLQALLPPGERAQIADSAMIQPTDALVPGRLDASIAAAARQEMLTRIALGVTFGVAITLLLAVIAIQADPARASKAAVLPTVNPAGKQ